MTEKLRYKYYNAKTIYVHEQIVLEIPITFTVDLLLSKPKRM